ncbi:hypothetical protein [Streptomyces zagrosensis]|uniref:CdiI immunity protein domain-containing protein n=1 Tax=Streptomyces zagrosensis TaxID=1042984 RepID=A0A7W9V252_9ACTN|nr:hypothetical protein [Streptomyces zagrosensis]MBB5939602.1 hypothetical protein [Streptomyces zagrosensis]
MDYDRLSGAHLILSAFGYHTGIPSFIEERHQVLQPTIRAAWNLSERGGRTLCEIADQVRQVALIVESDPNMQRISLRGMPTAENHEATIAALGEISDYLESWEIGYASKLRNAVPTSQELNLRFPQLNHLLHAYFGQDGIATEDDITEVEGLGMYIDDFHPTCPWRLPGLVGECHEALALFHDETSLRWFFEEEQGMGSGTLSWSEWIPLIADTVSGHMREHHGYRWQTGQES